MPTGKVLSRGWKNRVWAGEDLEEVTPYCRNDSGVSNVGNSRVPVNKCHRGCEMFMIVLIFPTCCAFSCGIESYRPPLH